MPKTLVGIYHEPREGAVLVVVPTVSLSAVQLDVNLVTGFQVKYNTIAGIVVILVSILCYCACPNLKEYQTKLNLLEKPLRLHSVSLFIHQFDKIKYQ